MKASVSACRIDWFGDGTRPARWRPRRRPAGVARASASGSTSRTLAAKTTKRLMPAERIDQHVADGREQELAERAGGRAGAERHRPPFLRQELAEGAEHQIERAARQAEADQHAGAELQHAGRGRIGHDHEAQRHRATRRRRARARRRTGRRRRRRRAGRRPTAGSGSRWRSRTCRGPSRIPSSSESGTARPRRAARR